MISINKNIFYVALFFVVFLASCKQDEEVSTKNAKANEHTYELMKQWYLWAEYLPTIDPKTYESPEEVLDALMYKSKDKWSYVTSAKEFDDLFQQGEYKSYGYLLSQDENLDIRVSFVYDQSPMARAGVKRGYILSKVNNIPVNDLIRNNTINDELGKSSNKYQFINHNGVSFDVTVSQDVVKINTVLYKNIIQEGSRQVGYLVFNSFLQTSMAELKSAFEYFKSNNVNELVLDLRYNGGGSGQVAEYLGSLIANVSAEEPFVEYKHNIQFSDSNYVKNIYPVEHALELDRVFVITTKNTASASEVIINCLKPYMDVKVIGSKSNGKPVGMYAFKYEDYAIVPICFQIYNKDGQSDYFDGIPVDSNQRDNLSMEWGDLNEDCLKEAIFYINNGYFSDPLARRSVIEERSPVELKGLSQIAGCL